jgi:hypothetical protein
VNSATCRRHCSEAASSRRRKQAHGRSQAQKVNDELLLLRPRMRINTCFSNETDNYVGLALKSSTQDERSSRRRTSSHSITQRSEKSQQTNGFFEKASYVLPLTLNGCTKHPLPQNASTPTKRFQFDQLISTDSSSTNVPQIGH